jgi:hypothetical protein
MRTLRKVTERQIMDLRQAEFSLRVALARVKTGGARTPLPRIRAALRSMAGAIRHAERAMVNPEPTPWNPE